MVDIICIFSQDGRIFLIHAIDHTLSPVDRSDVGKAEELRQRERRVLAVRQRQQLSSSRTIAPDNSESAQSSRAERKNEPRGNAFQSPTALPSCRHKIKSLCYFYAQALFFM